MADLVDEVFDHLLEQAAARGLLDMTYRIDSTDVRAMPSDPDASKHYDPTAEEYYYGYGSTIDSTGSKIPIAVEFTDFLQTFATPRSWCVNPFMTPLTY